LAASAVHGVNASQLQLAKALAERLIRLSRNVTVVMTVQAPTV
jgi:hypothetical protein